MKGGSSIFFPCQPCFSSQGSSLKKKNLQFCCNAKTKTESSGSRNLEHNITSSFSFKNRVGVPLNELASFDQYMDDKGKVIQAMFPEKSTSQQLNEEQWKVKLSPVQVFFLTYHPVIHITARYITAPEDYPPEIPRDITKFLEFLITRCELEYLQTDSMPIGFNVSAKGALYLESDEENQNWMKSQLHVTLTYAVSPLLAWVPQDVTQNLLDSILRNYAEDINKGLAVRIVADYNKFKRNMPKKSV